MRNDVDVFISETDRFVPGHRNGIIRITGTEGGNINLFIMSEPVEHLKNLRDECQRQIDAVTAEKSANGKTSDPMEPDVVHPEPNTGSVEVMDGGYLASGGSIEAMPASHRSAADAIEEDIPAPSRIEQTVRIPSVEENEMPF